MRSLEALLSMSRLTEAKTFTKNLFPELSRRLVLRGATIA
jgi:hypothetical protein